MTEGKSLTKKQVLLKAPLEHLTEKVKEEIRTWPDDQEPTAMQLLYVADLCKQEEASNFVTSLVTAFYHRRCYDEGVSPTDVVARAPWRTE